MLLRQLSVFLENRPGQLVEITKLLAEHRIDLQAINIAETSDYGVLRIICDDADSAMKILQNEGYITRLNHVNCIEIKDEVGGLNRILRRLLEQGIDIEYMYSVFGGKEGKARMIVRAKNDNKEICLAEDK